MASPRTFPDAPSLDVTYSGVPKRLIDHARDAKNRLLSGRTVPESTERKEEVPRLPPDTTREHFNKAISDLTSKLNSEKVVINDQALKDGWYMEHP